MSDWHPDPARHIVRLPYATVIDGKRCMKAYAADRACVYLTCGANGFDTRWNVYTVTVVNLAEQLGPLVSSQGTLAAAIDQAAVQ